MELPVQSTTDTAPIPAPFHRTTCTGYASGLPHTASTTFHLPTCHSQEFLRRHGTHGTVERAAGPARWAGHSVFVMTSCRPNMNWLGQATFSGAVSMASEPDSERLGAHSAVSATIPCSTCVTASQSPRPSRKLCREFRRVSLGLFFLEEPDHA